MDKHFDVVIAGAGIVGLAHALVAARRGLRVAVVERDHRCVGASIRNFGFVTVSGQRAGDTWRRARRSRDIWAEVAPEAGIAVEHRGLWLRARRPAARAVLEAFVASGMGAGCTLHDPRDAARLAPGLRCERAAGVMHSPHELRVESRDAIPRLAAWLARRHGVQFFYGEQVLEVQPPALRTSLRTLHAERVLLCPGTELTGVAAAALAPHRLKLTRLQMLRVRPEAPLRLPGAVMGDLSLVRYHGWADLPEALPLREQLESEQAACLRHGIHLIAVQSSDGSLVVGDSHHDDASPLPFASDEVDRLILSQLGDTLEVGRCEVLERWVGVYPTGHAEDCLIAAPDGATRVVVVTSGTGASTAFGIAEDVFAAW